MTRDELIADIKSAVCEVLPENEELSGEDLDAAETAMEETIKSACEAIDTQEDEDKDADFDDPVKVAERAGLGGKKE